MHILFRIKRALPQAVERASEGGALHPLWDVIGEAECILEGGANRATKDDLHRIAVDLEAGWTNRTVAPK